MVQMPFSGDRFKKAVHKVYHGSNRRCTVRSRDYIACFSFFTMFLGGGNALELQQMNMNLMSQNNGHCEYPICQTVCQQLNQQTGCYECNADCGTGSGMNLGGISFFSSCTC